MTRNSFRLIKYHWPSDYKVMSNDTLHNDQHQNNIIIYLLEESSSVQNLKRMLKSVRVFKINRRKNDGFTWPMFTLSESL